jgi:hypothetical protein
MTTKRPEHAAVFCNRTDMHFSGSMARHCGGWVSKHECPVCGRTMRIAHNYLGGQKPVCTGSRFWCPHEQTAGTLGWDNIRALLNASSIGSVRRSLKA